MRPLYGFRGFDSKNLSVLLHNIRNFNDLERLTLF